MNEDTNNTTGPDNDEDADPTSEDSAQLSALLKRSMGEPGESNVDVLGGVQKKLRERSEGKFYADGWSTVRTAPVATYLITSLFMLAIVFVIYAALSSLSGTAVEVKTDPKPIQVIPHR